MNLIKLHSSRIAGLFVIFSASLVFFSCQTTLPSASSLPEQQLQTVQTITEEFIPFGETGLLGRVSHNDSTMMVQLKIEEDPVIMRLLMMGLTIWVDSTASRQQGLGVVFPGAGPVLRQRAAGSDRFPARDQGTDTLASYNHQPLLDIVKQRNMVYRYGGRAEFIENQMAEIFLDDQGHLNYIMRLPLSAVGIRQPGQGRLSVGLVSEVPVFQMENPDSQSSTGERRGRPVYPYPRYGSPQQRQSMEPINQWIIFDFSAQGPESR